MAAWIHQKLDQDGGVGLGSSGMDCWCVFMKANDAKLATISGKKPTAGSAVFAIMAKTLISDS